MDIDISVIDDVKEIKSMMADEFIAREEALVRLQQINNNIQALNARAEQIIGSVEAKKAAKTKEREDENGK